MDRQEIFEMFCKNVEFLQKTVPPDDIYIFAEQTFLAALFFLKKYSTLVDIEAEKDKDPAMYKYASNLMLMLDAKEKNLNCKFDLGMDEFE